MAYQNVPKRWTSQSFLKVYLLQRVGGAVAALGRLGPVKAEVLADALPQVLRGQGDVQTHGNHGEDHGRLHGDQAHACVTRGRGAGGRCRGLGNIRGSVILLFGARINRGRVGRVHGGAESQDQVLRCRAFIAENARG